MTGPSPDDVELTADDLRTLQTLADRPGAPWNTDVDLTDTDSGTDTDNPEPAQDPEDTGKGSGNPEAARYRRQLRDTEAERDALVERIERMQTTEVTSRVADRLAQPTDLFAFGLTLADVLGDDGEVDPERVDTAVSDLLASRPGLGKGAPQAFPDLGGGRRGTSPPAGASWADVLRPPKA